METPVAPVAPAAPAADTPATESSSTLRVLVAVDVQNCFMFNNDDANKTFLNLGDQTESQALANEIAELSKDAHITVFTRDFHPLNHISFVGDEGRETIAGTTWPHHCRNTKVTCKPRTDASSFKKPEVTVSNVKTIMEKNGEQVGDGKVKIISQAAETPVGQDAETPIGQAAETPVGQDAETPIGQAAETPIGQAAETLIGDVEVRGPELSYMFYMTDLKDIVYTLNQENKKGKYKIGSSITMDETTESPMGLEPSLVTWAVEPLEVNKKKYVALTKGERCNQESYSAFNYHIDYNYDDVTKPQINQSFNALVKENSTGLWEFILKELAESSKTEVEIIVCGLVGNVCVMHTVMQGIGMWNKVYAGENSNVKVKMVFSLKGTRFTPVLSPNNMKPFVNIDDMKTNDTDRGFLKLINERSPNNSGVFQVDVDTENNFQSIVPTNVIDHVAIFSYKGEDSGFSYKVTGKQEAVPVEQQTPSAQQTPPAGQDGGRRRRRRTQKRNGAMQRRTRRRGCNCKNRRTCKHSRRPCRFHCRKSCKH